MRRLRAGFVTQLPGRLGSPSDPTTGVCHRMAGRGPDEGGRKPAGSGQRKCAPPAPEARSRGAKSPRWSAGRRAPFAKGRHAAPPPLALRATAGLDPPKRASAEAERR